MSIFILRQERAGDLKKTENKREGRCTNVHVDPESNITWGRCEVVYGYVAFIDLSTIEICLWILEDDDDDDDECEVRVLLWSIHNPQSTIHPVILGETEVARRP